MGVGTLTPAAKLHVSATTASTSAGIIEGPAGGNLYVDYGGSGYNYYDATQHTFRTPAGARATFIVNDRTYAIGNNERYAFGARYSAAGGSVYFGATSSSSTPDAQISNAGGGALMTFQNNGNIGIGTTTPAVALDVVGSLNLSDTATVGHLIVSGSVLGGFPPSVAEGRLSLTQGIPEPAGDQINQTTLYYVPSVGNKIALYNTATAKWEIWSVPELGISYSLAGLPANTNYDVFIYNNADTLALYLLAWTNNTTRVTLGRFNGVVTHGTLANYRLVGTIRTSEAGTCEDSLTQRFVWNKDNKILRRMSMVDATTHTYTANSGVYRPVRNVTTLGLTRVEFVTGELGNGSLVHLNIRLNGYVAALASIVVDSTNSTTTGFVNAGNTVADHIVITGGASNIYVQQGYHYLQAIEGSVGGLTAQFYLVESSPAFWG